MGRRRGGEGRGCREGRRRRRGGDAGAKACECANRVAQRPIDAQFGAFFVHRMPFVPKRSRIGALLCQGLPSSRARGLSCQPPAIARLPPASSPCLSPRLKADRDALNRFQAEGGERHRKRPGAEEAAEKGPRRRGLRRRDPHGGEVSVPSRPAATHAQRRHRRCDPRPAPPLPRSPPPPQQRRSPAPVPPPAPPAPGTHDSLPENPANHESTMSLFTKADGTSFC